MPDAGELSWRLVCYETDLSVGQVRATPLPNSSEGFPRQALVTRDVVGELVAYLNECKHLPIPLDAGSGEYLSEGGEYFLCSTHGALFRIEDGYCIEGPCAGASLEALPLRIEEGKIYVFPFQKRSSEDGS